MQSPDAPDGDHFRAAASFVLMLRTAGVQDVKVLRAMEMVPRVPFVDQRFFALADEDVMLPIAEGQTILPPSVLGRMLELLGPVEGRRVLLIGAGTGYSAAILARMGAQVVAVERSPRLADAAHDRLRQLGYSTIDIVLGDGLEGYAARAPFGAVLSTVAMDGLPPGFFPQIEPGGVMVVALGREGEQQMLTRAVRAGHGFDLTPIRPVRLPIARAVAR